MLRFVVIFVSSVLSLSACSKEQATERLAQEEPKTTEDKPKAAEDKPTTISEHVAEAKPEPYDESTVKSRTEIKPGTFVAASNALAIDLYQANRKQSGNIVFSPASISVAFAMTYGGAAGETAAEMQRVLHLPAGSAAHRAAGTLLSSWNAKSAAHELRIVNRLFGQQGYGFRESFLDLVSTQYGAPLETLDFGAVPNKQRVHINEWVAKQTNDRIKELLPTGSIDSNTRLVLTNAIYFLGKWAHGFNATHTRADWFKTAAGSKESVRMMRQLKSFRYAKAEDLQILEMPYEGSNFAMTFFLPKQNDGLGALEDRFDVEHLQRWTEKLRKQKIWVHLPRFEIKEARLPLKKLLVSLGMKQAFDRSLANFGAMANPTSAEEQLYIDNAFHQAFVRVDEAGTEAAAATAVVVRRKGMAMPGEGPPVFKADHPFLFVIRDTKNGALLFVGRVVDPS